MASKLSLTELHQRARTAKRTFTREVKARLKPGTKVKASDWDGRVRTATVETVYSDAVYFKELSLPWATLTMLVKHNPDL